MRTINDIIKSLNSEYEDWQEKLKRDGDFFDNINEKYSDQIYELIIALKRLCKEKDRDDLDVFLEVFEDKDIAEKLQKYVEKTLIYYKAFKPLRRRCVKEKEKVEEMITDIFDNFVLRFDSDILNRYEMLNENGDNQIDEVLQSMDNLTDYYVKHLMVKKNVVKDFMDETGLPEEVCELYAELYEKNYYELKLNLLMQGIDACYSNIKQIEEAKEKPKKLHS